MKGDQENLFLFSAEMISIKSQFLLKYC